MKIGELAARAGLNASALRYYEKMGLLALRTAREVSGVIPVMPSTARFSFASPATWASPSARSNSFSTVCATTLGWPSLEKTRPWQNPRNG